MSNAPKFFKKSPKKGDPICLNGLAEAIYAMAHAIETLSVHNGRVDWANGEPKIILNGEKKTS